jgi:hypothetical protein
VDIDGDGRPDIISGSFSGEIFFFRRKSRTEFESGKPLADRKGKIIRFANGTSGVFAVDWYGRGKLDILVGTTKGEVFLLPNEGDARAPAFGQPKPLEAGGKPMVIESGDAAPVAADWDGDGRIDLLAGTGNGSVLWYRNIGTPKEPKLAEAQVLVPPASIPPEGVDEPRPGQRGWRTKICVTDFNGDGRLDLLVGDISGNFQGKPNQSPKERAEEEAAARKLPGLMKSWAETFQKYHELLASAPATSPTETESRTKQLDALRQNLSRLKDEIAGAQKTLGFFELQRQSHGYVWMFLRKAGQRPEIGRRKP